MSPNVGGTKDRNGFGVMASYGVGKYLAEFLTGAFAALVFKYYETEIGLSSILCAVGLVLYSIWNAVNDPILGFLTAKPTPLSGRLGRRFPWIAIGVILCLFAFVFVFAVPRSLDPKRDSLAVFLWLIVSICLYDALYSTWELNYQSIFPDRFRSHDERTKAAGIATFIGVFGVAAGFVLPSLIVKHGKPETYLANAWIIAVAALVFFALLIPGVRETKGMVERYMAAQARPKTREDSFFRQLAAAFKQRNFLAFILLYFFYQSAAISMTGSIYYVGDYILGGKSITLIFAAMLIGALVSVPLWLAVGRKVKSNQTMIAAAAFALALFFVPMAFPMGYTGYLVSMSLWGIAFGGFWLTMTPAMADVIDDIVVKTGKRNDGIYLGFRAFAGRLAYAVQAASFAVVHILTGFQKDPRSSAALFGIRIHMALIPAILIATGAVVFILINTLNADKVEENRLKLKEMNI